MENSSPAPFQSTENTQQPEELSQQPTQTPQPSVQSTRSSLSSILYIVAFLLVLGLFGVMGFRLLSVWLRQQSIVPPTEVPLLITPLPEDEAVSDENAQVTVTAPLANSVITSPLTVAGTVPAGWMFEGSFSLKLTDEQQNEITSGRATEITPGSWMSGDPIPFSGELTFSTTAKNGFLILEKDNPSGLPENDQILPVPIRFE